MPMGPYSVPAYIKGEMYKPSGAGAFITFSLGMDGTERLLFPPLPRAILLQEKYYFSVPDITFSVQLTVDGFSLKEYNGGLYTTQSPLTTK